MPSVRITVCPVAVQGPGAEHGIADGVRDLNRMEGIDLIIVGRGGGSLEDLWAFNEEVVARAIHKSAIPVISAVGHEVDYTISDFVSDLRAPTPSAAAEIAVPDSRDVRAQVNDLSRRLLSSVKSTLDLLGARVAHAAGSYVLRRPEEMLRGVQQEVDELHSRLLRSIELRIERNRSRLELMREKLAVLSPKAILRRGYAVCRRYPELEIVRTVDQVDRRDAIEVELFDGSLTATVDKKSDY
jgi:exodeoxyribonuclease VII large subunit